jgi:heat shock protein HslJ/mannose-6-phosphate isomerase-like protein (cupin superfamily)
MLALAVTLFSALAGQAGDPPSLVGPTWVVVELAGTPVPAESAARQPSLAFVANRRVAGTDGCNRISGPYTLNGERLTFGALVMTRMFCAETEAVSRRFNDALPGTTGWRIANGRLELVGASGTPLAVFAPRREGGAAGTAPAPAAPLKSRVFDWAALTPTPIPNGERRLMLDGPTATVDLLHVHATTLAVGQVSGQAVRHPRDEVLIVKDGEVEVSLDGTTQKASAGAVLFFASGAVTRLKNVGAGPATYYVIYYETPKTPKQ